MLSKKMAFSLMSLITLLAFAFVVPSAMAAKITLAVTDVDAGDTCNCGHRQMSVPRTVSKRYMESQVLLTVTTDGVFPAVEDTGENDLVLLVLLCSCRVLSQKVPLP